MADSITYCIKIQHTKSYNCWWNTVLAEIKCSFPLTIFNLKKKIYLLLSHFEDDVLTNNIDYI